MQLFSVTALSNSHSLSTSKRNLDLSPACTRRRPRRPFLHVPAVLMAQAGLWRASARLQLLVLSVKVHGCLNAPHLPFVLREMFPLVAEILYVLPSLRPNTKASVRAKAEGCEPHPLQGRRLWARGLPSEGELWASSSSVGSFTKQRADASKQ